MYVYIYIQKEELVCAAYYIIELLALDYENKEASTASPPVQGIRHKA
jgi:hypothetical protein